MSHDPTKMDSIVAILDNKIDKMATYFHLCHVIQRFIPNKKYGSRSMQSNERRWLIGNL